MTTLTHYRVTLAYVCCGVSVRDGLIVDAAPILKWAVGKSLQYFRNWVRLKGGTIEPDGEK